MGPADESFKESHYAVLGVEETASLVDIRRAYRRLALRYHPDRAGTTGEPAFLRLSAAYRVLSNSIARAEYDTARRLGSPLGRGGELRIDIGPDGRPVARHRPHVSTLPRFTGPLDRLLRAGVLRLGSDGTVILELSHAEAVAGGTAAIELPLTVRCPTCGGISRPGGVWCRSCDFKGTIVRPVTVLLPVPRDVEPGVEHVISAHEIPEVARPLRFRFERS